MAYEEPTKEQQETADATLKRVRDNKARERMLHPLPTDEEEMEKHKHSSLIGQLKYVVQYHFFSF